jgi:hypothetical protein
MARKFATAINLQQNELQNARLQNLISNPSGVEGQFIWRSDLNELMIHDGTQWIAIPSVPISSADILDATITGGDIAPLTILAGNIANDTITATQLGPDCVTTSELAPLAVTNAEVAAAAAIARAKLDFGSGLVNADIAAAAAIVYSKLNLVGGIVNADVNASAAIARSKLDFGSGLVNADIAVAAGIAKTKLAALDIVNADVNVSAAIAESKLTLASDAAVGVASRRTLGLGALQAMPGNTTLNSIAAPATDVAFNAKKITGLADPTSAQDAATKAYVDATAVGLDIKPSVRVAASSTVTIASPGATIDGVSMVAGDRVLLLAQGGLTTTPHAANGIYVWNGAATPMTRSADADTSAEVNSGLFTFVEEGTTDNTGWVLSTNNPITLGTTALAFTQFSGTATVSDGAALLKTGNTLDVVVDNVGIEINADALRLKDGGVTNAKVASIDAATKLTGIAPIANGGTGQATAPLARAALVAPGRYDNAAIHTSATTIVINAATHGLGAGRNKFIQVIEEATGEVVETSLSIAANGDVTVGFDVAPLANTHRVLIVGW